MKKISTLFFAMFLTAGFSFAQNAATPNPDFEAWTHTNGSVPYDDPNNWNTLNPTTANIPFVGDVTCYKATAAGEYHNGAAAVKLITKDIAGNLINGIATTATINTSSQTITGGIPFTARPDSIMGWYRATPVGADSGFIQFMLTGSGGDNDTIGYAIFRTGSAPQTTFMRFSVPVTYHSSNAAMNSQWLLSSSAGASGQVENSTIWVDDLDLAITMVNTAKAIETGITVAPNPVSNGFIKVLNMNSTPATLTLYDVFGRTCGSWKIAGNDTGIDVSTLAPGSYIYSVISEEGAHLQSSKLLISN